MLNGITVIFEVGLAILRMCLSPFSSFLFLIVTLFLSSFLFLSHFKYSYLILFKGIFQRELFQFNDQADLIQHLRKRTATLYDPTILRRHVFSLPFELFISRFFVLPFTKHG
jgi:hypothetical protein